jgi:hypothetical protein
MASSSQADSVPYYRPRGPPVHIVKQAVSKRRIQDITITKRDLETELKSGEQDIQILNLEIETTILMLAEFVLVNVGDENQIVAVRARLEVDGSFGELYRGSFFVTGPGDEQFVRPGCVVAKKNRPSTKRPRIKWESKVIHSSAK